MSIHVVNAVTDFARLSADWDDLLDRSACGNPFLTHAWLEAWWSAYAGERDRLHIVCCRDDDGRLTGILPCYVQRSSGAVAPRRLRNLGDTRVGASRLGCIADASLESEVFEALSAYICAAKREWDVLDLHRLDSHSPFVDHVVERSRTAHLLVHRDTWTDCPSMALPGTPAEYLSCLSRGQRGKARRRRRKLDSQGVVAIERTTQPDELPDALRDVARMFEQSMQRKFQRPFAVSDRYVRFMSSVSEQFLASNRLGLIFLTVDGKRVAFLYQFRHRDTMYAHQTGFEEEWGDFRVGWIVYECAIEEAIRDGCTRYDFGPGRTEYKDRLGADDLADLARVLVYSRSIAGASCASSDAASRWVTRAAKRIAPPSVSDRLRREVNWRDLQRL